jgi:protein-L-isoaspartate(D-aspartate) O-methyltransferase
MRLRRLPPRRSPKRFRRLGMMRITGWAGFWTLCLAVAVGFSFGCLGEARNPDFQNTVNAHAKMMVQVQRAGVEDSRVLQAMRRVARDKFLPESLRSQAYADSTVKLECGSRLLSPVLVAQMMELLELEAGEKVLNLSTASGYEAALLSLLVKHVYSVELLQELVTLASQRLAEQGYLEVSVKCADPMSGWEAHAPFDAILVTDCVSSVPQVLVNQLKEGGRMVLCLGEEPTLSSLRMVSKENGKVQVREIEPGHFRQSAKPAVDKGQKSDK